MHLDNTSRAACSTLRPKTQQHQYDSDSPSSHSPARSSSVSAPSAHQEEPARFESDWFGEYEPADWDDYDEYAPGGMDDAMDVDEDLQDDEDDDGKGAPNVGMAEVEWEEEEDDEDGADHFEEEAGWEPPPREDSPAIAQDTTSGGSGDTDSNAEDDTHHTGSRAAQQRAHMHLHAKTFQVPFAGQAGMAINGQRERSAYEQYASTDTAVSNVYHPFRSKLDWDLARWAKMRGPGSTAVTELLEIEDVSDMFALSVSTDSLL